MDHTQEAHDQAGMTDRDNVVRTIADTLHVTAESATACLKALRATGYICVPLQPTQDMLSAAWASALAENARGVWESMTGVAEGILTAEGIPKDQAE